jgi:hypothetical protein
VLIWKTPVNGYVARWDLFNLAAMFIKCGEDVIVKKGIIEDDSVEFVRKGSYEFIPVETIEERKLVYIIKTIE